MEFLEGLKEWFFENAKKGSNAFWTLKREHGSKWKIVSVNNETGDKDASWEMLKNQLVSLIRDGGVTSLEVVFRLSQNDEGKSHPIKINSIARGSAGIAGIGSSFGGMDPWAMLIQQMQQGQQAQIAAIQKESELARKMDLILLEQQRNKSGEERLVGVLERLLEKPNVTGLLEKIVDRAFPDAPAIEGGAAATDDKALPPAGDGRATDGSIDFNPAVKGAMKGFAAADYPVDWNKPIDAVLILREAGIKDPEEKLLRFAEFLEKNPGMADQLEAMAHNAQPNVA